MSTTNLNSLLWGICLIVIEVTNKEESICFYNCIMTLNDTCYSKLLVKCSRPVCSWVYKCCVNSLVSLWMCNGIATGHILNKRRSGASAPPQHKALVLPTLGCPSSIKGTRPWLNQTHYLHTTYSTYYICGLNSSQNSGRLWPDQ